MAKTKAAPIQWVYFKAAHRLLEGTEGWVEIVGHSNRGTRLKLAGWIYSEHPFGEHGQPRQVESKPLRHINLMALPAALVDAGLLTSTHPVAKMLEIAFAHDEPLLVQDENSLHVTARLFSSKTACEAYEAAKKEQLARVEDATKRMGAFESSVRAQLEQLAGRVGRGNLTVLRLRDFCRWRQSDSTLKRYKAIVDCYNEAVCLTSSEIEKALEALNDFAAKWDATVIQMNNRLAALERTLPAPWGKSTSAKPEKENTNGSEDTETT